MTKRLLLAFCAAAVAQAGLVRLDIKERSDVLDGQAFGNSGSYERLTGKAYFAVNPKLPVNQAIADIDKAPRNKDGMVEFSSDFYLVRPKDPTKGNGTLLYEVSNRGGKTMMLHMNRAVASLDPRTAADFGDGFLMNQGYTLLWLGWEFDMPENPNVVYLYPPPTQGVQGIVRAEWTLERKETRHMVSDRNFKPYPIMNPDDPNLRLTVRDLVEGPRTTIPRADWHVENGHTVVSNAGFEPGRIYELVYTSQNPPVAGTGLAAVRDMVSWMRYGGYTAGAPEPVVPLKHAYGFGVSQSGRFLRTMMYFGFNRDERDRKVFEALLVDVAGGGRGGFNMRFAQPSRDSNPFTNTLTPVDIFPYTDLEQTDPQTGIKDGILTHSLKPEFWPKIFYINSGYEYYGRAASLIHINLDGKSDAKIAPSTRIYSMASGQHGPATFPPPKNGTQNLANPNPYTWTFRAFLSALDAWVREGKEPPPSKYAHLANGELTQLAGVKFPKIPGIVFPTLMHMAYPSNYGPEFRTKGIASQEPPEIGKPYPVMVPQVDQDGMDLGGIRMPQIAVPLATYTGWNLRSPEIGAPNQLSTQIGSFIPFARTKAERMKTGDPRLSIEERYSGKEDYLQKFEAAAKALAGDRYLLPGDVPALTQRGAAEWDYVNVKP